MLVVKNPSAKAGDVRGVGSTPASGRSPGGEQATHSSIVAWEIPWTEETGRLQFMGSQRVRQDWKDLAHQNVVFNCSFIWGELHMSDSGINFMLALWKHWEEFLLSLPWDSLCGWSSLPLTRLADSPGSPTGPSAYLRSNSDNFLFFFPDGPDV